MSKRTDRSVSYYAVLGSKLQTPGLNAPTRASLTAQRDKAAKVLGIGESLNVKLRRAIQEREELRRELRRYERYDMDVPEWLDLKLMQSDEYIQGLRWGIRDEMDRLFPRRKP